MAETKQKIPVAPDAVFYHDSETYTIVVELPGVHKKDIKFEAMENGFCLTAPRDDIEYRGCWVLPLKTDPEKAVATYSNGLLKATIPLAERVAGVMVPIR
ncbi:MAG: Hsp20/alpha crystallin family protein [Halobacteriota archaeon]